MFGDTVNTNTLTVNPSDQVARAKDFDGVFSYAAAPSTALATLGKTSGQQTGVSVSVTNADAGSGASHSNIQPVLACYYIQYRPS